MGSVFLILPPALLDPPTRLLWKFEGLILLSSRRSTFVASSAMQDPPVGDLGLDVLTNGLVFSHLWRMLGREEKRGLRRVSRYVRDLADAAIDSLDMRGKGAEELAITCGSGRTSRP
jgi:hypothetical protein